MEKENLARGANSHIEKWTREFLKESKKDVYAFKSSKKCKNVQMERVRQRYIIPGSHLFEHWS